MIRPQRRAHRLWWLGAVFALVVVALLGLRARRPIAVQDRLPGTAVGAETGAERVATPPGRAGDDSFPAGGRS